MTTIEVSKPIERQIATEHKPFSEKSNAMVEVLRRDKSLFEMKKAGYSTKDAVEATALKLAAAEGSEHSQSEKNLLNVIGHLGSFVIASRRADDLSNEAKDGYLSYDDRDELKNLKLNTLIPFNHSIKELINTDSTMTKSELDANLARLYMRMFSNDDPIVINERDSEGVAQSTLEYVSKDALNSVSVITNGMRHEIAAETMLSAAGYEFDYNVSAQEDARGADLFVYLETGWTYIDIKASEAAASKALSQRANSHAVWTGLRPSDFDGAKGSQTDAMRISFEEANSQADAFLARIYNVAQR